MIDISRRAAALVIALLAVGCVTAPPPSPPPASSPRTTAPASPSVASSTPSAAPDDPAGGWQFARLVDPEAAGAFSDVVAGPDGFLVAGGGGPIGQTAVALSSIDGQMWSREAINGSFAAPSSLLTVGALVFAVGGGESARCAHPASLATWARDAAGAWHEAPFDQQFCAGPGNATLLEFDGQLVLLGAGVGDVPFYLTSQDGLRWAAAGRDPFGNVYPQAALAHGLDLWVFGSAPDGHPVVIHRLAGQPFAPPVVIPGLAADVSVIGAVWLDDGLLAFVSAGGAAGILRPDGDAWVVASAEGLPADHVARIEVVGGHLVALGGTEAGIPEAWTSLDGSVWRPITLPADAGPGTTLRGIAVVSGTVALVGQVEAPDGTGAVGAIWTGPAGLIAP
jgi:hypothetical protein